MEGLDDELESEMDLMENLVDGMGYLLKMHRAGVCLQCVHGCVCVFEVCMGVRGVCACVLVHVCVWVCVWSVNACVRGVCVVCACVLGCVCLGCECACVHGLVRVCV